MRVAELHQAWPPEEEGGSALPAVGFSDAVNLQLPRLQAEVVVLSDGLTQVSEQERLISHAEAWGAAVVARDNAHPSCRWAAIPRAMLWEAGGLNPRLCAFYWLDDLMRRLPAVSNVYVSLGDDGLRRFDIMVDHYEEALADLGTLEAPL